MSRYRGLYCPHPECQMFICPKEVPSGETVSVVLAGAVVIGTCPNCEKEYSVRSDQIVEIESVGKPRRTTCGKDTKELGTLSV